MSDIYLSAITGMDITAQLYLSGVATEDPIQLAEIGATGEYSCDMPTVDAGEYLVIFSEDGNKIGSGWIVWDGEQEVDILGFLRKVVRNKREIKKVDGSWLLIIYDDDGISPILSKALKDIAGQQIADLSGGVLAVEEESSV